MIYFFRSRHTDISTYCPFVISTYRHPRHIDISTVHVPPPKSGTGGRLPSPYKKGAEGMGTIMNFELLIINFLFNVFPFHRLVTYRHPCRLVTYRHPCCRVTYRCPCCRCCEYPYCCHATYYHNLCYRYGSENSCP